MLPHIKVKYLGKFYMLNTLDMVFLMKLTLL
jgi:hypothetical protein